MPKQAEDLTGQKFNRLTVISRAENRCGKPAWLCVCDCGNEKIAAAKSIKNGHTKSCGCAYKIAADRRPVRHGHSRRKTNTAEYRAWQAMQSRCNPESDCHTHYRDLGIKVCERWRGVDGFKNFLADMGPRPSNDHSLDRKNGGASNYEPGNCRWATLAEQNLNRSSTVFIEHVGERLSITDWERKLGLKYMTIHSRVRWCRKLKMPLHMAIYPEEQIIHERYGRGWSAETKQESGIPTMDAD